MKGVELSAYAKLTRAIAHDTRAAVCLPSRDVAADVAFFHEMFGERAASFAEAADGEMAELLTRLSGPRVLMARALTFDGPVLLHPTSDLDSRLAELRTSGFDPTDRMDSPLGPCATFQSPGGQCFGLYQTARPGVDRSVIPPAR
jgi:hypothetical protein